MLYLAFPDDPRGFFKGEETTWLVYDTMIKETEFKPGDIAVITHWMFSEPAALLEVLEGVRTKGARVIYIGTLTQDTPMWRKQLVMAGVYDSLFVHNELNLGDVKKLIEKSRGATAYKEVLGEVAGKPEIPEIVEYTIDGSQQTEKVEGVVTVQTETVPVILPSRLIVVVGSWRRSGSSFVAMSIAHLLANEINQGQVQLVEHPEVDVPYLRAYFGYEDTKYVHWSEDGKGTPIELDGVTIHPMPDSQEPMNGEVALDAFLFRQLRRAFVIVDAGVLNNSNMLLKSADDIVYVMEPEPARLDSVVSMERYQSFVNTHSNVHLVMNKTTKYSSRVKVPDVPEDGRRNRSIKLTALFPSGVYLPYVNPEVVQKAAWSCLLPSMIPEVADNLNSLRTELIHRWIPTELQKTKKKRKWRAGRG